MTEFGGRGSFGERISMTCQVCMNSHHDNPKQVYAQDRRTGAYVQKTCPMCMCLDCVQLHDDPIRAKIRPLMMGQTLQSKYNLEVEEFKKGAKAPTKRNIEIKAPGPLNVPEALRAMGDLLGIGGPSASRQHRIGSTGCSCGKNAVSRCIGCDMALCMRCLKKHEC